MERGSRFPRGPRRQRVAATPIAFISAILRTYRKYGLDPDDALRAAHIPPLWLKRSDARITAAQLETFLGRAMQELDDEALGWFSRRLPWGSYGMLCRASLTSPDLGVALKRWCRHHRLLTDDILLTLTVKSSVARLAIAENRRLRELRELCLLTTLRYVHGYACWAVDSLVPLREVHFPFAPPAHDSIYPLLFPGPVRFSASEAGFSFDARYLTLPLRRDESALHTMLRRALPLTVRQYRRDRLLVQRVRDLLHGTGSATLSADRAASALHVSTRTLHRQLREEGAGFQALKDDIRRAQAVDQLYRTTRPIKQIASAIGFRNEKSFARAFKAWTGDSPDDFRRKAPRALNGLRGCP